MDPSLPKLSDPLHTSDNRISKQTDNQNSVQLRSFFLLGIFLFPFGSQNLKNALPPKGYQGFRNLARSDLQYCKKVMKYAIQNLNWVR